MAASSATRQKPVHAHVGRQAIFDRELEVHAYELLFRSGGGNFAAIDDPDRATAAVIMAAYAELELDQLAGDRPVSVNLPTAFLVGEYPIPLPPARTHLEVLEDVPVTSEVLAGIARLRQQGFQIWLDDFTLTSKTWPLVPLADVIKVDILGLSHDEIRARYRELAPLGKTLVAEKVDSQDALTVAFDLGFELFQGHFIEKPVVRHQEHMPHNQAVLLRLLARLYDPNLDIRQVERLLAAEVGLTIPIFKLARSAAFSSGKAIGSIGEAVARLGLQQLAALVMLAVVAESEDKPIELARQALVRARMCELLARESKMPPGEMFTAGLLSLIDALVDQPLDEVLARLPLTPTILEALSMRRSTPGKIVEAARGQSNGNFMRVDLSGIPPNATFVAWYEAIRWADQLIAAVA